MNEEKNKLLKFIFNIKEDTKRIKNSHKSRLIYSIIGYICPILAYLSFGLSFQLFDSGILIRIILGIFVSLFIIAFIIGSLEGLIYNFVIMKSSVKGIKNNEHKGVNIACLILSILYILYVICLGVILLGLITF